MFKIRNRNTGEWIDLRDINRGDFIEKYNDVTKTNSKTAARIIRRKQKMNNRLMKAAVHNDVEKIRDCLDVSRYKD